MSKVLEVLLKENSTFTTLVRSLFFTSLVSYVRIDISSQKVTLKEAVPCLPQDASQVMQQFLHEQQHLFALNISKEDSSLEDTQELEDGLVGEEEVSSLVDTDIIFSYEQAHHQFLGLTYDGQPVGYDLGPAQQVKSVYELESSEGVSWQQDTAWDTESETLTEQEAQEVIHEVQYRAVIGGTHEMDARSRRKLAMWEKFNKPYLFLFDKTSVVQTRDVNYTPAFY